MNLNIEIDRHICIYIQSVYLNKSKVLYFNKLLIFTLFSCYFTITLRHMCK